MAPTRRFRHLPHAHVGLGGVAIAVLGCSDPEPASAGSDGSSDGSTQADAGTLADGTGASAESGAADGTDGSGGSAGSDAGSSDGGDTPAQPPGIYPLEIIAPQPGLGIDSRWYRAYPGLEYRVPVGVFGGAYPFTYALTVHPEGMTIDAHTGILSWPDPPAAAEPYDVRVEVEDAAADVVAVQWTITVTAEGFVFVDASAPEGGDGTAASPFNSMGDFYGADHEDAGFDDFFVYWREGIYALEGTFEGTGSERYLAYPMTSKPHVWLAYPGETVVIDHSLGDGQGAALIQGMWAGGEAGNDAFIGGIRFEHMWNHAWRMFGNRMTFFEDSFVDGGPGADGANSSFLMWQRYDEGGHYHNFIKGCSFADLETGTGAAFLKLYGNEKLVIEDNQFSNAQLGAAGEGNIEGIAVKATSRFVDIRGNTLDGIIQHAIGGNFNLCHDVWIRYNNVKNSRTASGEDYGALVLNYNVEGVGEVHVDRNTFEGNVTVREASVEDGPFHFRDNVIVNDNAGDVPMDGSHIVCEACASPERVVVDSDNVVGSTADGVIDDEGRLAGAYRDEHLGLKGHELGR